MWVCFQMETAIFSWNLKIENFLIMILWGSGCSQFEVKDNWNGYSRKTNTGLHLRLIFEELLAVVSHSLFLKIQEFRKSTFNLVPGFAVTQRKTMRKTFGFFSPILSTQVRNFG